MKASSKLKIGLVVDDTIDKTDGVQQYVLILGKWLSEQGHDVHYLVGETTRTDLANIHSLSKNIPVRFNKNRLTIPLPAKRSAIKQLLQREKFDVLHVQVPYSPFMAGKVIAAADHTTAVIGTFHILPFSTFERFASKQLGRILRPTLKRFDHMLAVSKPARAFAEQSFGVDAEVCPNVINLGMYKKSVAGLKRPEDAKKKVVFLGRLVERKGAMQLLKAVATLPKRVQDSLEVIIGGKGELLAELKTYAKDANIAEMVRFEGFVAEEAKPAFLQQADIAVFPSTSGESFGIVLLEAMAADAGITIGGNNPGYSSVLADWPETLFDPNNTTEFARILESYLSNASKTRQLHALQQKAITQYDVAVVGKRIVTIYQNVIAKRKST